MCYCSILFYFFRHLWIVTPTLSGVPFRDVGEPSNFRIWRTGQRKSRRILPGLWTVGMDTISAGMPPVRHSIIALGFILKCIYTVVEWLVKEIDSLKFLFILIGGICGYDIHVFRDMSIVLLLLVFVLSI